MARKRKPEISFLNVIFCLLVIFIHIISYPVGAFPPGSTKYTLVMLPWRLASFVVPGFIMLSGVKVFLTGKDALPFGKYIKGRLRGVILPYTVAFLVYYIGFMLAYDYPLDIGFIVKHFLLGSLVYHLYFIPVLFQFDLLFPVWKRVVNACSPLLLIPFALLFSGLCENYLPSLLSAAFPRITFLYNDRIFTTYLGYWLAGCYIGKYYDAFCEMLKKNFRTVCSIFAFCAICMGFYSVLAYGGFSTVPAMNAIHSLYILAALLFSYALALKIPEAAFEKLSLFAKIDGASFYIYLYHVLVLFAADKLLSHFGIEAQGLAFLLRALVLYTVTPLASILYLGWKKKLRAAFRRTPSGGISA